MQFSFSNKNQFIVKFIIIIFHFSEIDIFTLNFSKQFNLLNCLIIKFYYYHFADQPNIINGVIMPAVKLIGKTVVITGANTGIGYETALDLAKRGAKIIMACRDLTKAAEAKSKVFLIVVYSSLSYNYFALF